MNSDLPTASPRRARLLILVGSLVAMALSVAMAVGGFRRAPITTDEQSYLLQAHLFATGRVKHPPPPFIQAFRYPMVIVDQTVGWLSRYPPAHALWLTPGVWLGSVYAMVALAAGAALTLTALCARRLGGSVTAVVVGLLLSPFFVFTYGTLMSHTSGMVSAAGMLLAYILWQQTGRHRWACVAGLAWAFLFLNRTYTAALMALPFGADALWQLARRRDRATFWGTAWFAGFALVGVAVIFGYNWITVGHPLRMTYLYYDPTDTLGFGLRHYYPVYPAPEPVTHSLAKGLTDLRDNLLALDRWLGGFRGGLAVWLALTVVGWSKRWTPVLVASAVSVWAGYVLFWYPGWNETGPNYYVEVLPAMVVAGSLGVAALVRRLASAPLPVRRGLAAVVLVLWGGAALLMGWEEGGRLREKQAKRAEIYRVLESAPPNTVILLHMNTTRDAWMNNDFVFNPRGVRGPVIVARDLPFSNAALFRYFRDFERVRLDGRAGAFRLDPVKDMPYLDFEFRISGLHRHTGGNVADPEDGRLIRIAREGDHEPGVLLFGRFASVYPGRFAAEFEVRSRPGADGAPAATVEIVTDMGRTVVAEQEIGETPEWTTVVLEFTEDGYRKIEPRAHFHGQGEIEIRFVRLRDLDAPPDDGA